MFHWQLQVELFHNSKDTPAVVSKIEASLDKATGEVIRMSPRFVTIRCYLSSCTESGADRG